MQIRQDTMLGFLGAPGVRLVIPAYQREYAWGPDQCSELWLDVHRAARSGRRHFVGTILYTPEEPQSDGAPRVAVIDGQQRLTTLSVMLAALAAHLRRTGADLPGTGPDELAAAYLTLGAGAAAQPKLLPSRGDGPVWVTVVRALAEGAVPALLQSPSNIAGNLAFFLQKMADPGFDPTALWRGIQALFAITAQVDDPDQAQLVFESLNSKGRPLTVADMVRNYLMLSESRDEQRRLYEEYWRPMEGLFAPDPGSLRLDTAIKGWLSIRFRKTRMRSPELVYSGFKQYAEDTYDGTKEDMLRELRGFSVMWAENYRYHGVKKYRSSYDWAINGAPTLTSHYKLKKPDNEECAERIRAAMREANAQW